MKLNHLILLSSIVAGSGMSSCNSKNTGSQSSKENFKFIDRANMDTTIKPGDDFFGYANGHWLKTAVIPGDKTRWGSFDQLADNTNKAVKEILESVASKSNANKGSKEYNVANFYKSGMDTTSIDKLGVKAIQSELDMINNIQNEKDLLNAITTLTKKGVATVFGAYIGPDDRNVSQEIAQFGQAGLGMPSKDSYTDKDPTAEENRTAYKFMIQEFLKLTGQDVATAEKNAALVFSIENKLAAASLYPAEMRDPVKMYNKFSLDEFSKQTPNIDWKTLFGQLNINGQDSLLVSVPGYYKTLGKELKATPINDWKQYLTFHLISDMSPYLGDKAETLSFNFYGKKLRGQKEMKPRWERVMGVINNSIGDQLGQLYVEKNFKPEAKEKMLVLVNNLQLAFGERIKQLDWMSDVTKEKALIKLNGFIKKIGYPDKWKSYDNLVIVPDNYAQNVLNANEFEYNYQLSKLGKPVDRAEWFMTPNTVNAYYNPAFNEIVFPAAILQFPFFDFDADDAVNYGGIGAVIGHEMTHGFDDQGAQYAADGNLKNWWTPEDEKKFKAKTDVVVKQFNAYKVLDSVPVNGSLTLGENIADLGGLAIAYQAFKKTKQGQGNEIIDGFTPDQRFFMSWAQIWRGVATKETTLQLIKVDPHSPGIWRSNGPLSNFEPFYKAFNVKEGDKMYRPEAERAKIW
ncbi:MAG TPA: M13 family metallopeptidase [Edaphocola sp.]|nr:M13 family metallopeptidase [Edaphocola sp.]